MNLNEYSEDHILQQLKSADEAVSETAFDALFARHKEKVYMKAFLTLQNETEAEDVLQEVFYSLWTNRKKLTINTSLKNYLMTAAKHKALDLIRRRQIHSRFEASVTGQEEQYLPTDKLENKEEERSLYQALQSISSPVTRDALNLYYFEGLSHRQTGEKLGITELASRSQVHNALQQLRKFFKKQ